MIITDVLRPADLAIDLAVKSKKELMEVLSHRAGIAIGFDEALILQALLAREDLGSTGFGHGVALPHASILSLSAPFGLFARLARPVDFDSIDGSHVDLVVLLLLPTRTRQVDLNVLSCVARKLRSQSVRLALRAAVDTNSIFSALTVDD